MPGDWIKMYRKSIDSAAFQSEGLWKVWCWCLMRASYKSQWVPMKTGRGETLVEVKRGQFIFGRKAASRELGMAASTVYKRMIVLEKLGNLNIESSRHFSVVTVCNFDSYQGVDEPAVAAKGTTKEQPRNNQGTTKEHIQERQEIQEGKEEGSAHARQIVPGNEDWESRVYYRPGFDTPEVREKVSQWIDHLGGWGPIFNMAQTATEAMQRFGSPADFIEAVSFAISSNRNLLTHRPSFAASRDQQAEPPKDLFSFRGH
jgi:hypothetical protein